MAEAIITLPDGRRLRLTGESREAITAQATRISQAFEQDAQGIPIIEEDLRRIVSPPATRPPTARRTLTIGIPPFAFQAHLKGAPARAVNATDEFLRDALPPEVVLGAMGAMATGGVSTGIAARQAVASSGVGQAISKLPMLLRGAAGSLARNLLRFGPATAGAGAGGAVGAGLEERAAGGSPVEIAEAASRGARQAMAGEAVGLGAGAVLGGLVAPMSTSLLAPAAPVGRLLRMTREKTAELAGRARTWLRGAPREAQDAALELAAEFPDQAAAAQAAAAKLREIVESATRKSGASRVIDDAGLNRAWEALTPAARQALGTIDNFRSGVSRVATFANSGVGRDLLESGAVYAAASAFGPAAGAVVWGLRQMIAPNALVRWITKEKLPDPVIRTLGREAVLVPMAREAQQDD